MKIAEEILDELARRGITVQVNGQTIRLSPRKALDEELLSCVKEHKSEIISAIAGSTAKTEPPYSAGVRLESVAERPEPSEHHSFSHITDRTVEGVGAMIIPSFAFPVRLSEKYRPRRVADFVGLPKTKRILSTFVAKPYACSFLLYGPSGIGKSSMAHAMAEEMEAEFHHLGSQRCNLENLEEVCRICLYAPLSGGFHFVLIDEVDSASRAAQLALLSKLDSTDAPKGTVFVFTCNSAGNLEPRFLSRCLPIDFSSDQMPMEISEHLQKVWHAEGGDRNGPDFTRLVKECRSNVRDCLGRLEVELMDR